MSRGKVFNNRVILGWCDTSTVSANTNSYTLLFPTSYTNIFQIVEGYYEPNIKNNSDGVSRQVLNCVSGALIAYTISTMTIARTGNKNMYLIIGI